MNRDRFHLDGVVGRALEQGREVRITDAEGYGFHLEIDGQPVTETYDGEGIPWDSIGFPLLPRRGGQTVTEDALDIARDVMFTGSEPRCPHCTGPREWFTVTRDDGDQVEVSRCRRCKRTVPERGKA